MGEIAASVSPPQQREVMDNLICYCFKYTESDIEADIVRHRKSTIEERIKEEKKAGGCQCKTRNPKGI